MSAEPVSPPPRTWVLIRQPNGGPDRWMAIADPAAYQPPLSAEPLPGWIFLFGFLVGADGEADEWPCLLYARPAGRDWEMVPYVYLAPPGPELGKANARILRDRWRRAGL